MQAIHVRFSREPLRRLGALVTAVAAVLAMTTGCGGDDEKEPDTPVSPTPIAAGRVAPIPSNAMYNAADVVFAQDVLANVQRGVEMAELAKAKATNPGVRKLAAKGAEDRQAALLLLPMWLERYKQPMPAIAVSSAPAGHTEPSRQQQSQAPRSTATQGAGTQGPGGNPAPIDHSPASVPVSGADVAALKAASGVAFDRLFLQLLIKIDAAMDILVNGQQWSGINGPLMSLSHELSDKEKAESAAARLFLGN